MPYGSRRGSYHKNTYVFTCFQTCIVWFLWAWLWQLPTTHFLRTRFDCLIGHSLTHAGKRSEQGVREAVSDTLFPSTTVKFVVRCVCVLFHASGFVHEPSIVNAKASNQPNNQPTNQPTDQPTNQPTNQPRSILFSNFRPSYIFLSNACPSNFVSHFLSLSDLSFPTREPEELTGVVFSLRDNGFLVYLPKYHIKVRIAVDVQVLIIVHVRGGVKTIAPTPPPPATKTFFCMTLSLLSQVLVVGVVL